MQSAYKNGHSTETALVKIQNDILQEIDKKSCVILVLLDLSAAFDTVDHTTLLKRLKIRFGIRGKAFEWLSSYLIGRYQAVMINGVQSNHQVLNCSVPQGSVLGPKLFIDYQSPVGDIIRKHGLEAHFYADDSQLYLSFNPENSNSAIEQVEKCINDVRQWMACNSLKLNDDKTDLIVLGTPHKLSQSKDW